MTSPLTTSQFATGSPICDMWMWIAEWMEMRSASLNSCLNSYKLVHANVNPASRPDRMLVASAHNTMVYSYECTSQF